MAIDGNILLGVAFDSASYSSAQKQLQNLSRSANVDIKVNNAPLGRINADLHEFDKSLQAANARVLAFGASTGAVYGIATAFTEVGKAFINVEAKFKSIQVVLKSTTDVFDNFKGSIFAIGRDTGKSFEEVTDAAQELVRQGLKISETLQRTSDAMILSRQSGLSASEAVTSLTAALNTFNQEALTSTEVINKLANVDSNFAVSQKDLIDAISRSGSAAQDAGVQFDKLLAFTTSLQQTTARGGAVIGNALKSIFTRVQRSTTLEALEEFNVQTKDLQGNVLSADVLLQNLANTYKTLSTAERSAISEQVAGIQQINQLKALLGDLARANSVYGQALKTSSGSVNEAIDRNKSLNETLKATLNSTKLNALEFSETVGKLALAPALKFPIGTANALFDIFKDKDQDSKSTGQKLGEGILRGIGSVLSGPGLVLATAIVTNTLKELGRFTLSIVSDYSSLNNKTKEQVNVQQAISQILSDGNNKYASRLLAARNIKEEESAIRLIMLEQNNIIARKNSMYAQPVRNIVNQGGDVLREGAFKLPKRAAGGYLPIQEEQNDIQRGVGGASSAARPKVIPNFNFGGGKRGTIVANTDEYIVPNYGGGEGSAIFNPKMVAQHGLPNGAQKINAAGGFVPNFARYYHGTSKDQLFENKNREDLNFRKTQRGVFITTNPAYASAYSMDNDSMNTMSAITGRKNRNSRVIPIELDVKNPYIMSNDEIYDYDRAKSYIKFQREIANKARRLGHDAVDYGHGTISYIGDPKNLKPFYTAKNASTGFVPNFAELPDKSIYRHYYKQYKKFLKKGSFESDLGGYGHWDGMGRYNKSTVMYRGTGGNEIGELLEKGQFQSQWQDSIEKTPATFISADLSQAAHYAKRTGRDPFGFFEDDDLKNKGSQFIYGLRKNIVKGNYGPDVVKTMQGDTATNVALRNPIKSKEDLRLLMAYDPAAKNVKSALKPVPYGYLKEVLGGAAGGLIPNFVRKSKYKFPKISSATMEANISKNLSNLPPEDIKYFSRAYEDYGNISGVFAKATNFSKEDFVDVMSALSPANPLERNTLDALRYTLFAKSKLSTGVSRQSLNPDEISSIPAPTYGANRRKAAKIIIGSEQLTGNKRNSFSSNIINPFASEDVTVDFRAQSSALGRKFDVKNAPSMNREQYDKVSQAFRNVGSNFGISGLGIQAADWIGQRMNTKTAKGQGLNRGIIKFLYENPDKITLENLDFLLSAPTKAAARKEYLKKVSSMGISKLGSDSLISIPRMGDGFVPNFADKLLRSEAIAKIMAAKNQIFGAEFTKRTTGESRTGTFRLARNVKTGKVGGSLPYKAKDHQLVPVFDMGLSKKKGAGEAYRMLPYEGLNKLHIDGKEYDVVDNMAGGFIPNFLPNRDLQKKFTEQFYKAKRSLQP
ncbi:phage tail tape measure protein, partial [Flavobacterium sp.]|uniref:phage tail tape measure protein n=1 Tax=Flavobacterium sp. TaxID=239 RepID=UPI0038FCBC65